MNVGQNFICIIGNFEIFLSCLISPSNVIHYYRFLAIFGCELLGTVQPSGFERSRLLDRLLMNTILTMRLLSEIAYTVSAVVSNTPHFYRLKGSIRLRRPYHIVEHHKGDRRLWLLTRLEESCSKKCIMAPVLAYTFEASKLGLRVSWSETNIQNLAADHNTSDFTINDQPVSVVTNFCYLGLILTSESNSHDELHSPHDSS